MADYQTLLVDNKDGVTTVTLNRPEKRNAMSPQLHREMYDCLTNLRYDKDTRVIIITGAGESFCAGQDLKQYFIEMDSQPHRVRSLGDECAIDAGRLRFRRGCRRYTDETERRRRRGPHSDVGLVQIGEHVGDRVRHRDRRASGIKQPDRTRVRGYVFQHHRAGVS